MPEEIIKAPKNEQHPIEIPELEIAKPEKGERSFLSQIDDDLRFLDVVSEIPTAPPKYHFQRIKVYISGATKRLYIWDGTDWRYCSLS